MDINFTFDAEYLARLRAREPETLKHFCNYFHTPIRNKVRRTTFHRQEAEDLVQEVFVRALKKIDAGEPQNPAKLPGYMFGICQNVIWHDRRPRKTQSAENFDITSLVDHLENAEDKLLRELRNSQIKRALEKLYPRDREALNRVFFLRQDRERVAAEMGITRERLRVILCLALKRLRKEWDILQQTGTPEPPSGNPRRQSAKGA